MSGEQTGFEVRATEKENPIHKVQLLTYFEVNRHEVASINQLTKYLTERLRLPMVMQEV